MTSQDWTLVAQGHEYRCNRIHRDRWKFDFSSALQTSSGNARVIHINGQTLVAFSTGIYGVAGRQGYLNGSPVGTPVGAATGGVSPWDLSIGAWYYGGPVYYPISGQIQLVALYPWTPTR